METTITRKGQVTQLTRKMQQNNCVVSFKGGYCKFVFETSDIPDGVMLEDKVEVQLVIKGEDE